MVVAAAAAAAAVAAIVVGGFLSNPSEIREEDFSLGIDKCLA